LPCSLRLRPRPRLRHAELNRRHLKTPEDTC
jgi:hypothetical protein